MATNESGHKGLKLTALALAILAIAGLFVTCSKNDPSGKE